MARRPGHTSQRDRMDRLRAEKAAKEAKKAAPAPDDDGDDEGGDDDEASPPPKKVAAKAGLAKASGDKKPKERKAAAPKRGTRKVVVWAVLDATALKTVATFPYKDKDKAEAHCAKLIRDKKKAFLVQPLKQNAD